MTLLQIALVPKRGCLNARFAPLPTKQPAIIPVCPVWVVLDMFVFIKVSTLTTPIHRSSSCRELSCPKTRELLVSLSVVFECTESGRALAWFSRVWNLNLKSSASEPSCHVPEQGSRPANLGYRRTGYQSVVTGPASSRNLSDMQILGPKPRSTESETPGVGPPSSLCFSRLSR